MTPSDLAQLGLRSCIVCNSTSIQSHLTKPSPPKPPSSQSLHLDYLAQLVEGESHDAREPVASSDGSRTRASPCSNPSMTSSGVGPRRSTARTSRPLGFRLAFVATQTNIVLIGNVGLGKTHLAIALGHAACLNGHSVLFTTAVDIINTLAAAQAVGQLKREFRRYLPKPAILIVDELGYLPIDKHGADLLFQIISQRYERAPIVITTNRAYKHWSQIFNNDSTLTSAILDRVLHHADTVIIEGQRASA